MISTAIITVLKETCFMAVLATFAILTMASCTPEPQPADCVPAPDGAKNVLETTPLVLPRGQEDDFCVACVKAKIGFASCQREYARKKGESRDAISARATERACTDAGYPKDECPTSALIGVQCKNDKPAPGTLSSGQALQLLSGSGPNNALDDTKKTDTAAPTGPAKSID